MHVPCLKCRHQKTKLTELGAFPLAIASGQKKKPCYLPAPNTDSDLTSALDFHSQRLEKMTSHGTTSAGRDLWRPLFQVHAQGRADFKIRSRCSEPCPVLNISRQTFFSHQVLLSPALRICPPQVEDSLPGAPLLHLPTTCGWRLREEEVQGRWPCLNPVALPHPPCRSSEPPLAF